MTKQTIEEIEAEIEKLQQTEQLTSAKIKPITDKISSLKADLEIKMKKVFTTKFLNTYKASPIQLKVINVTVAGSCDECPYQSYDSHYSMSSDSGYDCDKARKRIIDDCVRNEVNGKIPIPEWCPLENAVPRCWICKTELKDNNPNCSNLTNHSQYKMPKERTCVNCAYRWAIPDTINKCPNCQAKSMEIINNDN